MNRLPCVGGDAPIAPVILVQNHATPGGKKAANLFGLRRADEGIGPYGVLGDGRNHPDAAVFARLWPGTRIALYLAQLGQKRNLLRNRCNYDSMQS